VHVVKESTACPATPKCAERARIDKLLGTQIADEDVKATLESLGMSVKADAEGGA
jgi:phenylalanyl-tRNA synthetase beta subunit